MSVTFGPDVDFRVRAHSAMAKSFRIARSVDGADVHPALARKADICGKVLAETRRLSRAGWFGSLLSQLAIRAGELLDDIPIALDPATNGPSFALAAKLHRELENAQAAISERRRDVRSASSLPDVK